MIIGKKKKAFHGSPFPSNGAAIVYRDRDRFLLNSDHFNCMPFILELSKYRNLYVEEKSLLELATYLDPRFTDGRSLELEGIIRREIGDLRLLNQSEKPNNDAAKAAPKKKKSALEELFEEDYNDADVVDVATHELDLYYSQLKIPITEYPLTWWKNRATLFPYLSRLAKNYLCVPATSVLSERVFSRVSKVITKETPRITNQHAEELIYLHMNKEIVPINV